MPTPAVLSYATNLRRALNGPDSGNRSRFLSDLANGGPANAVESLLSRAVRRREGIFFSGEGWARTLLAHVPSGSWKRYYDPAVGSGDLLLAAAKSFELEGSAAATLEKWGERLVALDTSEAFVQIAWDRIRALCYLRHMESGGELPRRLSSGPPVTFVAQNALQKPLTIKQGDCILMNPPYTHGSAPAWCSTSSGRVSRAALFVERFLSLAPPGVALVALVPDVLRSGTRYKKLRAMVEAKGEVHEFSGAGRFSPSADIDVAVLAITTRKEPAPSIKADITKALSVGCLFDVHVGSVVPHRTKNNGLPRPYLHAGSVPSWTESDTFEQAKFSASVFNGPLVAIRRTSSPSDAQRARAAIAKNRGPFLVENHLIICQPKDGSLLSCQELMENLKDERTSAWLNKRIRCRHLTVGSVAEIPIWEI